MNFEIFRNLGIVDFEKIRISEKFHVDGLGFIV